MESEILNFSKVEEDPFADMQTDLPNVTNVANEWNIWKPTTLQIILNYGYLIFGITKFFLVIGVVLVDILLAYLILRYKRLRKNFNLYILHYVIVNFASHIISPIFVIVHLLLRVGYGSVFMVYCYLNMLEETLTYMSFVLALCLALDWTFFHFEKYTGQIQTAYNHKFSIIYALFGLLSILNCSTCNFSSHWYASKLLFYSMPPFVVTLLFMHYKRRRMALNNEQLKTEHYLWISTIAFGVFIPVYVLDIVFRCLNDNVNVNLVSILFFLEQISSIISVVSPICILIYLMKWNKHVRMAYDTTFRKTVRTYGSDNLDDASDNEEIISDDVQKTTTVVTDIPGVQDIFVA